MPSRLSFGWLAWGRKLSADQSIFPKDEKD